jgi:DNA-directed RNA polymerase specialized sigma subunit
MTTDTPPPDTGIPVTEVVPVDPYARWQQTKTPQDLNLVVKTLEPKIAYNLHRYGLGADPLATSKARVYAAKAIKSFDPASGNSLATWVDRNLQQLTRFKRQRATAIHVPERIQLDNYAISRAAVDFEEEYGREPELDELADRAGMKITRVNQVRSAFKKMTSEAPFEGNLEGSVTPDFLSEAMGIVWDEAEKKDRQILEMKTGFGGKHQPMEAQDVAARLGMSAVELSRRSARLGAKLDELMEHLDKS